MRCITTMVVPPMSRGARRKFPGIHHLRRRSRRNPWPGSKKISRTAPRQGPDSAPRRSQREHRGGERDPGDHTWRDARNRRSESELQNVQRRQFVGTKSDPLARFLKRPERVKGSAPRIQPGRQTLSRGFSGNSSPNGPIDFKRQFCTVGTPMSPLLRLSHRLHVCTLRLME